MVAPQTLTRMQLNRATLARQMLLKRETVSAVDAVRRLCGMQAQEPKHPFIGLWTRVEGFRREQLFSALHEREIVRATLMRATLHLMSAADYAALRTALQPALDGAMSAIGSRSQGLDLEQVLPAARKLFARRPHRFDELRAALSASFPEVNERALGYATRIKLPLVMVPSEDRWAFPPSAQFALAQQWLDEPLSDERSPERLLEGYLAGFGPASAADFATWSGMPGAKRTLEDMRERLAVFHDESGRELFDLPDAPRPAARAPAPARYLPEFDNLMLAHADRTRVLADEHRSVVVTKNLRVRATILCNGFVAGTWTIKRTKTKAALEVSPFAELSQRTIKQLTSEGESLLAFAEPDAGTHELVFAEAA